MKEEIFREQTLTDLRGAEKGRRSMSALLILLFVRSRVEAYLDYVVTKTRDVQEYIIHAIIPVTAQLMESFLK